MGLMISESISQIEGQVSQKLEVALQKELHTTWLCYIHMTAFRKCQKLECLLQDERMKPEMTDEAQLKQRGKLKTFENVTCFIVLLGWSLAQVVVAPSR